MCVCIHYYLTQIFGLELKHTAHSDFGDLGLTITLSVELTNRSLLWILRGVWEGALALFYNRLIVVCAKVTFSLFFSFSIFWVRNSDLHPQSRHGGTVQSFAMTFNCRQRTQGFHQIAGGANVIDLPGAVVAVQAEAAAQGGTLDIVVLTEVRASTAQAMNAACQRLQHLGFDVGTTNGVVGTLAQHRLGIIAFVRTGSVFSPAVQVNINAMHNHLNGMEGTLAAFSSPAGSFAVVCLPVPSANRHLNRLAQDALLQDVVQLLVQHHGPFLFLAGHFNTPTAVNDVLVGNLFNGANYVGARNRFAQLLLMHGLSDATRATAGPNVTLWTDRTTHQGVSASPFSHF